MSGWEAVLTVLQLHCDVHCAALHLNDLWSLLQTGSHAFSHFSIRLHFSKWLPLCFSGCQVPSIGLPFLSQNTTDDLLLLCGGSLICLNSFTAQMTRPLHDELFWYFLIVHVRDAGCSKAVVTLLVGSISAEDSKAFSFSWRILCPIGTSVYHGLSDGIESLKCMGLQ